MFHGPVMRLIVHPSDDECATSLWKYHSHAFAMRMNPCPASPNFVCILRRIVPLMRSAVTSESP